MRILSVVVAIVMALPFSPVKSTVLRDCEDTGKPTCYTLDDGVWRVVSSYAPYRSKAVKLCKPLRVSVPCLTIPKRGKATYFHMTGR
jgi:hypothetical protein